VDTGRKLGPAAGSGAYSRKQKVGILEVEGSTMTQNGPPSSTNRTSSASNYFPTRSKLGPKPLTGVD